jgi:PelA/Pel-15E family pectate lyase
VRTGWGQQHDALTLLPALARNYEPASLASHESGSLLMFLMRKPDFGRKGPGGEYRLRGDRGGLLVW